MRLAWVAEELGGYACLYLGSDFRQLLQHVQAREVRVGAVVGLHAGGAERGHDLLPRSFQLYRTPRMLRIFIIIEVFFKV